MSRFKKNAWNQARLSSFLNHIYFGGNNNGLIDISLKLTYQMNIQISNEHTTFFLISYQDIPKNPTSNLPFFLSFSLTWSNLPSLLMKTILILDKYLLGFFVHTLHQVHSILLRKRGHVGDYFLVCSHSSCVPFSHCLLYAESLHLYRNWVFILDLSC